MMVELRSILVFISWIALIECRMEPFVVGGTATQIKRFPHSAYIYISCFKKVEKQNQFLGWVCGGSIVNELIILTAAHCLDECGDKRSSFTATVGHSYYAKGEHYSVLRNYIHPKYKSGGSSFDIALERLKNPLRLQMNVKRIALMLHPPYFIKSQIAGWGMTDEDINKLPKHLNYVDQYVWRTKKCEELIKDLSEGTFCASSGHSQSFSSRGDSGSALVVRGYIQIGLVSYKMPAISKSLVVYTDTGYFYKWILKHAQRLYCTNAK